MPIMTLLAQTTSPSSLPSLLFLLAMVGVFYFFILRPQRNRVRKQQQLQATLQVGDHVHTIGGIMGVIREIDEDSIVLEVEQGLLRLARRAIAGKAASGS